MFCTFLALAVDPKVVCHWSEGDGPCLVEEQSRSVFGRTASTLGEVVFELGVGKLVRLTETMDCSSDLNADTAIGCNFVGEVVLINDLLWDVFQGHFHAFPAICKFCVQMH